jgi:antirestriction protein ArdC
MSKQSEIRQQITNRIVEALKAGTAPWRKPWSDLANTGHPANVVSKRSYSGVNPLLLELVAQERSYSSRWWATFRQWHELGLRVKARPSHVRPGEWGTRVVFCKPVTKPVARTDADESDDGQPNQRQSRFFLLRTYTVFNAEQIEGDGSEKYLARPCNTSTFVDFAPAEAVIAATGADVRHGGNRAFFRPSDDYIQMPPKDAFESQVAYYGTLTHEACHWTGHETRLNRLKRNARFADAAYSFEELIAEIGGCFLCSEVRVPQSDDLSNQHAYLGHWLGILQQDPSAIFSAASQASTAVDFILSFSRKEEDTNGADEESEAVPAGVVS